MVFKVYFYFSSGDYNTEDPLSFSPDNIEKKLFLWMLLENDLFYESLDEENLKYMALNIIY